MAATVLFEIKKKSRSPLTKKSPFPLVFHLGTEKSSIVTWQIYRGVLKPDGVVVTSQEDMKNLYHMGYFGKGTLSRSAPRFNADYSAEDPIEERAMSFHRYQRHKQLREKAEAEGTLESNCNLDPPKVILVKLPGTEEKKESSSDVTVISETGLRRPVPRILARAKNLKRKDREDGDAADTHDCPREAEDNASDGKVGDNEGSDNGATSEKICSIDEGSDQEAANEGTGSAEVGNEDPDIFECDSSGEQITKSGEDCAELSSVEPQNDDDGSNDIIEVDSQTGTEVVGEDDKSTAADESQDKKVADGDKTDGTEEACTSAVDRHESETGDSPKQASVTDEQDDEEGQPLEIDLSAPETGSENSVKMKAPDEQKDSKAELLEINLATSETSTGGGKEVSRPSKQERKRCHTVEEEDAIASDCDEVEMINSGASEEPEVFSTEDPWPITESLQLFFEEAYFLSYGLGCLIVKDGDEDLELLKLWQRLCGLCDNFPARYAAYHHFRSKGWVVRSGAKFAADYLLYKDGPPFYHASFSVIVRSVWADTLEEQPDHRLQSWPTLSGLIRVNGNASKAVLLCHVIMPRDADLTTPHVLRSFKIQELLVRRWIVSEEREKRDDAS